MKWILNCQRPPGIWVFLVLFSLQASLHASSGCPQWIGKFRVEAELGSGGMGTVYQVRKKQWWFWKSHPVALKILHTRATYFNIRRFHREYRVLQHLGAPKTLHPSIPKVYETGISGGRPFFTMEKVSGGTLAEIMAGRDNPLPPLMVARIFLQVAEALALMQRAGVAAHRDIKPSNIMVTDTGVAKIIDFGLSRLRSESSLDDETQSLIGTSAYFAPELILKYSTGDEKTDLFAMGVSMFEVLANDLPFQADSHIQLFSLIVAGTDKPDLRARAPSIPHLLVDIVRQLIERDLSQRYQKFDDVVRDLRAAIQHMESNQ